MAVNDKARVRSLLSAKWPKATTLSKERLDGFAAKLEATDASTDEEITTELETINKYTPFEDLIAADDKVANDINNAKKQALKELKDEEKAKAKQPDPKPDDKTENAELKELKEQFATLSAKLEAKEQKEAEVSLKSRFEKDERLKGVPASWIKNNAPKTEEEFEEAVTTLASDFEKFATEHKLESYTGGIPTSGAGTPPPTGKPAEVKQEVADGLASKLLNGF